MWHEGDGSPIRAEETTVVWTREEDRAGQCSVSVAEGMEVERRRAVGRLGWTWRKCVEEDTNQLGPREEMAQRRRFVMVMEKDERVTLIFLFISFVSGMDNKAEEFLPDFPSSRK